jgi:GT2 family glycosyltransferase
MISLIICSIDPVKFAAVSAMYQAALAGVEWEMIAIHDAKSLAEGYNRGIAQSRGDTLIFSHDDVEIISPDLGGKVTRGLQRFDLIGVAGATRIINACWMSAGPPFIFGQVAHIHPSGAIVMVDIYGTPRRTIGNIQGLDGVFLAARRSLLDKISFDARTFDGFHVYDTDFSFGAYRAGFQVGVVNDINLLHASGGRFDEVWQKYAIRFELKWRADLPRVPPPVFQWAAAQVKTREQALAVMNPSFW